MSLLFYKRPDFIQRPDQLNFTSCQRIVARQTANKKAIPDEVSFDRVIENKALPPCSINDFMDYLVYVAHDAETLQFFMWYKDYTKRFSILSESSQKLSPPIDLIVGKSSPANPADANGRAAKETFPHPDTLLNHPEQPFRDEVNRIATHYIAPSAPRELNISYKDRIAILQALQNTTHPSVFAGVADLIEVTLRNQAHPNFLRWTICNGNKPKVVMARTMATLFLTSAIVLSVLLCLSHHSRWWRLFAFIPFFLSILIFVASYKGICLILHHAGSSRDVKPWEDIDSATSVKEEEERIGVDGKSTLSAFTVGSTNTSIRTKWLDAFGRKNEFDDEPWVHKWKNRPLFQRVLVKRTKIHERGIRIMMEKIVLQSQLWALMGALILTIVITAIPVGKVI